MVLNRFSATGIFKLSQARSLPFLLPAAYVVFGFFYLQHYFITDVNSWLGLVLAPYLLLIRKGNYSFRYLLPTLVCLGLAFFIPITTLVYLTLIFGLLLALESTIGKVSYYILFLLLILSSVFQYFSNFFGFPIRLWLSKIAGQILLLLGKPVEVSGNLIQLNGEIFSVDPACTGLRMLATSFLLALFVLAFYHRKTGTNVRFLVVSGLLLFTLLLNIVANLLRIVLLVLFKIPPENIFHDVVGMACLVVYVVLPLLFITGKLFKNSTVSAKKVSAHFQISKRNILLNLVLFIGISAAGFKTATIKSNRNTTQNNLELSGYKKQIVQDGITKFENQNYLLYVKPVWFYSAEHSPMVCWTGSGYSFQSIKEEVVKGRKIYTAELKNGTDKLHTAWWFDRENCKTIDQLEWRWEAAKTNRQFNLINITAATPEALQIKTKELLSQPVFN